MHVPLADQSEIFTEGAADLWWERNRAALEGRDWSEDPVVDVLHRNGVRASRVLEVGCADGGRVAHLAEAWGSQTVVGIEPSRAAVTSGKGRFPGVSFIVGTHRRVGGGLGTFDLVVLGFFLYLLPREDLFRTVTAVDEVLAAGGHLAIYDFDPGSARRRPYSHDERVTTWKTDHAALFRSNPQYLTVETRIFTHGLGDPADPDERLAVSLLRKLSAEQAYPTS